MESSETTVQGHETTPASTPTVTSARKVITTPDFSGTPQPIGPLTERADWPQGALGVFVSIHGFEGVVVEIINQSIKVLSADRITQRFNVHRLKALFAPPDRSRPLSVPERSTPVVSTESTPTEPEPAEPARIHITTPDFSAPVRAIRTYASQPDFPECAYGKHVEIPGYSGVVVEIVKGSLKVQSAEGPIRSFNVGVLKKLYGRA